MARQQSVNEDRWTLYDIYVEGLNLMKKQGETKSKSRKNSGFDHASHLVINKTKTAKNVIPQTRRRQPSMDSASREYMNQNKIRATTPSVASRFPSLLPPVPAWGILPAFCNSSSPYPQGDYFTAAMTDCHTSRRDINGYDFSEGFPYKAFSQVVDTTANVHASKMVTCPGQISSIRSWSDGDRLFDCKPFPGRPTFPGSSLQCISEPPPGSYNQSCLVSVMQDECNQAAGKKGSKRHQCPSEQPHGVQRVALENLESIKLKKDFSYSGVFYDRDSNSTSRGIVVDTLPTLKRPKMDNPCNVVLSMNPLVPECFQHLEQRPEAPVLHGDVIDLTKDLASTSATRSTGVTDIQSHSISVMQDECNQVVGKKGFKRHQRPSEKPHGVQNVALENSESRKLKKDLSYSGVLYDSDSTSSGTGVDTLPPLKCPKMENPCNVVLSMSQSLAPECFSHLEKSPEAPESYVIDLTKDPASTSASRSGVTDNSPGLDLSNGSTLPEELTIDCKQKEIDQPSASEIKSGSVDDSQGLNSCGVVVVSEEPTSDHKEQELQVRSKTDQVNAEAKSDTLVSAADYDIGMKSKDTKIRGVFLVDSFTGAQLKEHLYSFHKVTGQISAQEATGNPTHYGVENMCQLCNGDKLLFAPTPIYCSSCRARIKQNLFYHWTTDESGTRHCFCGSCYKGFPPTGTISFQGVSISKAKLQKEKNKNDEKNEESWVQCDKCERWLHQICALYSDKRDPEGKAEYVCPKCCLDEIESGVRVPLPKTAAFGAKDLPRTMLSDHIEQRLFNSLKQEREEMAKALGKKINEVPGAADLVVRVVLSVEKKVQVKQEFRDIFHGENYPEAFPYRSKVILLFQKIEGVDICLFGMYVQEFGSECGSPNQRCIYISYLDSVKYFRPERLAVTGEALRTFIYHELLIGYLDYCKKRGFVTCHIWACPPLKGDDYIFYCHPETQKEPKSDKLRAWYKSMLRKAAKDNIVVDYSNLYDKFFVPQGECNTKITAARLPYFDGDYWSDAAQNIVKKVDSESGGSQKVKRQITKRTAKAMGHNTPSDATKDILVMQELGETILRSKEDFIVVHLQFMCMCCHEAIISGSRWFCNQCKKFQLCSRCLDPEKDVDGEKTHTSTSGEKHPLIQVLVNDVPLDTEDKDVSLENGFFDDRNTFLSFCQENHYQFDTLRCAKHSSMMIQDQLHMNTKATGGSTSSVYHKDVTAEDPLRCEVREILSVLKHTFQCNPTETNPCVYPNCRKIRLLFRHTSQCNVRVSGDCQLCRKLWKILGWHSKSCRESNCKIPRCIDLKKHMETRDSQSKTWQKVVVAGLASD